MIHYGARRRRIGAESFAREEGKGSRGEGGDCVGDGNHGGGCGSLWERSNSLLPGQIWTGEGAANTAGSRGLIDQGTLREKKRGNRSSSPGKEVGKKKKVACSKKIKKGSLLLGEEGNFAIRGAEDR